MYSNSTPELDLHEAHQEYLDNLLREAYSRIGTEELIEEEIIDIETMYMERFIDCPESQKPSYINFAETMTKMFKAITVEELVEDQILPDVDEDDIIQYYHKKYKE